MSLDRIVVVGTCGSGKSTLARRLAAVLDVPYVELDALFWNPNWVESSDEEFRDRVERALSAPRWVVDGNYSRLRELIWGRATSVVWLDYPFRVSFSRLVGRTLRRLWTREEVCNGNQESFREAFMSRKSILLWALQKAPVYANEYPSALASDFPHLDAQRFRRSEEAEAFLSAIEWERAG